MSSLVSQARRISRGVRRRLVNLLDEGESTDDSASSGTNPTPRSDYRRTWNEQAADVAAAKVAVAGYENEDELARTAQEALQYLKDTARIKPDDVVLDIGCGVGRTGAVVAPICGKWIGCDVSSQMLEFAAERLADCDNVELVEVSGHDLAPIADSSVDVVYAIVVFMHLDEWDRYAYVTEALRILRPGGRLVVNNMNLSSDDGWAFFENHCAIAPEARPTHISKTSTPDEFTAYFERAGFTGIQVLSENPWLTGIGTKPTP